MCTTFSQEKPHLGLIMALRRRLSTKYWVGQKVHSGTHFGKDLNEIFAQPNILSMDSLEMGYVKGILLCKGVFGSSNRA